MDWIPKDDEEVWYTIRVRAKVVRVDDAKKNAAIEVCTEPLKGQLVLAPLEFLSPTG